MYALSHQALSLSEGCWAQEEVLTPVQLRPAMLVCLVQVSLQSHAVPLRRGKELPTKQCHIFENGVYPLYSNQHTSSRLETPVGRREAQTLAWLTVNPFLTSRTESCLKSRDRLMTVIWKGGPSVMTEYTTGSSKKCRFTTSSVLLTPTYCPYVHPLCGGLAVDDRAS